MVPSGDADARAPPIPLKPLRLHSKRAEVKAEKRSNAHFPCRAATPRLLVVLICRARLCGSLAGVSASRSCRRCLTNCKCVDISFGECKWRDVTRAGMSFESPPRRLPSAEPFCLRSARAETSAQCHQKMAEKLFPNREDAEGQKLPLFDFSRCLGTFSRSLLFCSARAAAGLDRPGSYLLRENEEDYDLMTVIKSFDLNMCSAVLTIFLLGIFLPRRGPLTPSPFLFTISFSVSIFLSASQ